MNILIRPRRKLANHWTGQCSVLRQNSGFISVKNS
jgi:hypothetical protein